MKKVVLPATITSIQSAAFFGCYSLEEFHANNPVPVDLSAMINVFHEVPVSSCVLYVPVGSKILYETATQWQDFENIFEDQYAGMEQAAQSSIRTGIRDGNLWIRGLKCGTAISVINLNGTVIFSGIMPDGELLVCLPTSGVYLLRFKNTTLKIINA